MKGQQCHKALWLNLNGIKPSNPTDASLDRKLDTGNKVGVEAKKLLADKISNNKVKCVKEGVDRYKRILAECFVNNQSLSKYLVREGYAFAYRKYSLKFIEDENYAKKNKNGMWGMTFEYPWDYRKKN